MENLTIKEWSIIEGLIRRRLSWAERSLNKDLLDYQRQARTQTITELNNLIEKIEINKLSV